MSLRVTYVSASWCAPCRLVSKWWDKFAASYDRQKITFTKTDATDDAAACRRMNIQSFPTFILFRDGVEVARFGNETERSLRQRITDHFHLTTHP